MPSRLDGGLEQKPLYEVTNGVFDGQVSFLDVGRHRRGDTNRQIDNPCQFAFLRRQRDGA